MKAIEMVILNEEYTSLNRLVRRERINMARLYHIINNAKSNSKMILNTSENRRDKNSKHYEPVLEHCKRLYDAIRRDGDSAYGVLESVFSCPHGDDGRINAVKGLSLQNISKPIRHAIGDLYTDIDIVNCHPVILLQYCRHRNIECDYLEELVQDRDELIDKLIRKNNNRVSRDDIKKAILSLINGGDADYNNIELKTSFIKNFRKEIKTIIKTISSSNTDLYNRVRRKRIENKLNFNHDGACMSVILQGIENRMLMVMEEVFVSNGVPLDTMIPVHDGMMIPTKYMGDNSASLIELCEKRILDVMNYEVSIVIKPMDSHIDLINFPDKDVMKKDIPINVLDTWKPDYDKFENKDDIFDLIQEYRLSLPWESKQALLNDFIPRAGRYMKKIWFPNSFIVNFGDGDVDISTNLKIPTLCWVKGSKGEEYVIEIDCVNFFNDLEISTKLPVYKKITFNPDPNKINNKEFNCYNGLQAKLVDTVDMDRISPILNHIRTCWANNNDDLYDYIMHWFHQCFKFPWIKTGIVLLLYGIQGAGKGILIDKFIIPFIYGDKIACATQGLTPITQRFNSTCMNKLFICANEVSNEGGFHTSFEKLKSIITDPTLSIERKGIDIFKDYPNFINFIFTTNNTDSVKLGKTDRRYCCLETSGIYRNNFEYFDKLFECCNQDTANHFYTYAYNYNKTRNVKHIPRTSLKDDMMVLSINSVEKFSNDVKEFIERGYTPINWNRVDEWDTILCNRMEEPSKVINSRYLYQVFNNWCVSNNETKKSNTVFGRDIKKFFEFIRKRNGIVYVLKNSA